MSQVVNLQRKPTKLYLLVREYFQTIIYNFEWILYGMSHWVPSYTPIVSTLLSTLYLKASQKAPNCRANTRLNANSPAFHKHEFKTNLGWAIKGSTLARPNVEWILAYVRETFFNRVELVCLCSALRYLTCLISMMLEAIFHWGRLPMYNYDFLAAKATL